jgi:hypothetical protein
MADHTEAVTGSDTGTKHGGGREEPLYPPAATLKEAAIRLLHPIPLTIFTLLVGVTLLIAANVIGWDSGGVLTRMSTLEFARGLITYLFAVTTIGTAVVLVMAALMREISDQSYQRGKEILALLLGVFGTIVGFYFGSEAGAARSVVEFTVKQPLVTPSTVAAGGTVRLIALVSGGAVPYRYGVGTEEDPSDLTLDRPVGPDGWIVADFIVPQVAANTDLGITLAVKDSVGRTTSTRSIVRVTGPTSP